MRIGRRGVSPVISVILTVAIVVILAATTSAFALGLGKINEPAPNVADTTGEFIPGGGVDEQVVRITHNAGDSVDVENIEIIVRASGPDDDLPTEARLVDLPGNGYFGVTLDDSNIEGNDDLIDQRLNAGGQIIVVDDTNTWAAGETIQFRITVGEADFRDSPIGSNPEADELEVVIVHTPSNAIISEHTFTP